MKKTLLVDIICYFFILLFLYTGAAKLMDTHLFKEQLLSSPLLGSMAGIIAWALPIGELLLAIALFIPRLRLKALYFTLALMTLFTVYVVAILFMDNHLSCSCGGIIEELSPRQHVLFNSACVILSVVAIVVERKQQPTPRFNWLTGSSAIGLFLLLGWTMFTAFSAPSNVKTGMEGRLLPSFDLLLADSITHFNTADIPKGQPFIVIGFSPFCTHCQAETRSILSHIQQFRNTRIYYVTPFPFDEMKVFYRHYKLSQYPNITMGRDLKDSFLRYFQAPGVPCTIVFDAKKRAKLVMLTEADAIALTKAVAE
jgi:Methylamine utilisation protein MauE